MGENTWTQGEEHHILGAVVGGRRQTVVGRGETVREGEGGEGREG